MSGAGKVWNNQRFFNWIYRVLDATAAAKWLHSLIRTNISNINIFWHTSICHYSWNVLAKFDENNFSLYNLQLHSLAMPGDYLLSWNSKTNGTMRPHGVNDNGSRFPRKSNPLQTCIYIFLILIAQGSVTEEDTIMSKVAKGKGKSQGQNPQQKWENCKMCWAAR